MEISNKRRWTVGGGHDFLKEASALNFQSDGNSNTRCSCWADDLENIYALLFRVLGFSFRLATTNVGWHVTQESSSFWCPIPSPSRRGWCCSTKASFMTVVNKTHHCLSSRYVCSVSWSWLFSQCCTIGSALFLCVPSPITRPSAAEAARGGKWGWRLRLDEEVLDAPEELRLPVIWGAGAQDEQGQERFALYSSWI